MPEPAPQRHRRLLAALQKQSLFTAYLDPQLRPDLEAEAADPEVPEPAKLVRQDMLERVRELLQDPERRPELVSEAPGVSARSLRLFFSTDLVVIVPGLMGSSLSDVKGGFGLIWLNPNVAFRDRLGLLELAPYADPETDLDPRVQIEPSGTLPIIYDLLRGDLEPRRYSVALFPVDWRKDVEPAAGRLRDHLAGLIDSGDQPIHVIAHSQGAMVARRALQLLRDQIGEDALRGRVKNLVLLGPANYGSFSAAFALAGNHDLIRQISPYVVGPSDGFGPLLRSMSGVYQLLPCAADRIPWLDDADHDLSRPGFWDPAVDDDRLVRFFGWAKQIDTQFFADRTTVLLGDNYGTPTVSGVAFADGGLRASHQSGGDGTVPDCCAYVEAAATYRVRNAEHLRLPTYPRVLRAVRDVLAGRPIVPDAGLAAVSRDEALDPGAPLPAVQPFALFMAATAPAARAPKAMPAEEPLPTPAEKPSEARAPSKAPAPPFRRLRAFAFDPALNRNLDTIGINQVTMNVRWEKGLEAGPVGDYLEVVDADPAAGSFYEPVDLNDPHLLAQDGLAPSEGNPKFHQQMVYAVCMNTIGVFEQALGRPAMWAPRIVKQKDGSVASEFVRRLRVYPHALREENAYYSPEKKALLFGYFRARATGGGLLPPGGTVFSCLSHDVVAHETTHALLDGLHRYFIEPSNPDVLAFHEAFADVVALFQHFSYPEVLRDQVAKTRGDLTRQNLLGELAVEFGQARGMDGALRNAIGSKVNGVWHPYEPKETDYQESSEPHARGSVLVAAVFDAYLTIYKRRIAPLVRVATAGSGILPEGELHPDLVRMLSEEAAKSARHVLNMCVRALDYAPPVDLTFGEYLRAVLTADADLVPDDDLHYRLAVIGAFARRGIYPPEVRSLSEENLLWRGPSGGYQLDGGDFELIRQLSTLTGRPTADRKELFDRMRADAALVHDRLRSDTLPAGYDRFLGLCLDPDAPATIRRDGGGRPRVEVHSVRPALRVGPDGQSQMDLVVEITQRRGAYLDEQVQKQAEAGRAKGKLPPEDFEFRGGCTLLIDIKTGKVRYAIVKDVMDEPRLQQQRAFLRQMGEDRALEMTYRESANGTDGEPFAMLHRV